MGEMTTREIYTGLYERRRIKLNFSVGLSVINRDIKIFVKRN